MEWTQRQIDLVRRLIAAAKPSAIRDAKGNPMFANGSILDSASQAADELERDLDREATRDGFDVDALRLAEARDEVEHARRALNQIADAVGLEQRAEWRDVVACENVIGEVERKVGMRRRDDTVDAARFASPALGRAWPRDEAIPLDCGPGVFVGRAVCNGREPATVDLGFVDVPLNGLRLVRSAAVGPRELHVPRDVDEAYMRTAAASCLSLAAFCSAIKQHATGCRRAPGPYRCSACHDAGVVPVNGDLHLCPACEGRSTGLEPATGCDHGDGSCTSTIRPRPCSTWGTTRTPYLRETMDRLGTPAADIGCGCAPSPSVARLRRDLAREAGRCKVCTVCNGTGQSAPRHTCSTCDGTGREPLDEVQP